MEKERQFYTQGGSGHCFFTQVPKVLVFYNGFTTLGTFIELLLVALIS